MICWLPSGFVDARTTEGEEYALDVTQVQWKTKNESMPRALMMTARRVSRANIPLFLGVSPFLVGVVAETRSLSALDVDDWAAAAAAFLDFLVAPGDDALEPVALESSFFTSSVSSGCVGSMYVSRRDEKATAAETQTTGVKVSMRRTMTPAK